MFAVECHFAEEHVDWALDMDRIFAFIDYRRENPPAGTMIKAICDSFDKNKKHSDGGVKKPKKFKSDEERLAWERQQLAALKAVFGQAGGVVKEGQK